MTIDIFQINSQRVIARILIVNIACPMRGQIGMTFLARRNLVLAASRQWRPSSCLTTDIPFIQPYAVLYKQQRLIWQKRWARARGKVWLGEEHPAVGVFWDISSLTVLPLAGRISSYHPHLKMTPLTQDGRIEAKALTVSEMPVASISTGYSLVSA